MIDVFILINMLLYVFILSLMAVVSFRMIKKQLVRVKKNSRLTIIKGDRVDK